MTERKKRRGNCLLGRAVAEALEGRRMLSFGVTTTASTYVIDNGGDLQFTVLKNGAATSSTIHLGDITSIKFKGQEMLASYAQTSRYSHYEQGLGSVANISYTIGGNNDWILVTCDDSAETSGAVIQYYAVRKGDDNIYMASLPIDVNNGPGEGRFIAYLDRSVFSNPEAPSDNAGTTGAIEGSDVFGHADGTTTSKFYNMGRRMIDNVYHGLTGTAGNGASVGAWMYMGNRETSSGGPFFKDIDYQSSSTQVEIYNCLFTGHTQTEAFRQGLKGPYACQFTDGSAPVQPDYSWMDALNLQGWTPASGRGTLSGTTSGVPSGHDVVVGLSNSTAQYWVRPDSTGHYSISGILPGTYTETLYDTELEVGTKSVTISAGNMTASNIVDTFYIPSNPIFRIGTWDGTPLGFLNSEPLTAGGPGKIEIMHPSDVRMDNWTSTPNFVIGSNTDSQWPLAQFMGVNNGQRITFNLSSAQVQNLTLRVGITWGFSGARPRITVNSGQSYAWTSAIPTASVDLNSRGITRGTWRGVNQLYAFSIPSSALRAGTNTIDLPLVSGSYVSGQTWLSPNVAYDAIDLVPTTSASPAAIKTVTITPGSSSIGLNGTRTFTAVAKDASGNVINANFSWSAARGSIDPNGDYIAPATGGSDTITVTATTTRTPGYNTTSSSTSTVSSSITATGSTTVTVMAGAVSGQVFQDSNASGVYDTGEPPLVGVQVYLDANNNGVLDSGELSTSSDATGAYSFPGVPDGSYTVREIAPANYIFSGTAAGITVGTGSSTSVNLANVQIAYSGTSAADSYVVRRNAAGQYEILIAGSLAYTLPNSIPSLGFSLGAGDDALTLDYANGSPVPAGGISFDAGSGSNSLSVVNGAAAVGDAVTVSGGAVSLNAADGAAGKLALSVTRGAAVSLTGAEHVSSLALAAGASVDLLDYPLTVSAAIPNNAIRSYLAGGLLGSSTAAADAQHICGVGYVPDFASGGTRIQSTYIGDANLSGTVDADDYMLIDRGFAKHLGSWSAGDFNYDGVVDASDYLLLDKTEAVLSGATPSPELLASRTATLGAAYATELLAALAPVPASAPTLSTAPAGAPLSAVISGIPVSGSVVVNSQVELSAASSDPSRQATHTWRIYRKGRLRLSGAGSSLTFIPHAPGTYTVTLLTTDAVSGGSTSVTESVLVTTPEPRKHHPGPRPIRTALSAMAIRVGRRGANMKTD